MKSRHPERVSGPIWPFKPQLCAASKPLRHTWSASAAEAAQWVLKQVQHDDAGEVVPKC
jgi:hypothetical protein